MKKMYLVKMAAAILCGVFAVSLASCKKDDPVVSAFKFSPAKVEVAPEASVNVTVSGGTEPYVVKSGDAKIATASVNKNVITVTGVKEGKVTLTVTDKNKKTAMLSVTVKKAAALSFDKNSVSVEVGKEETISVKNGVAPYTATPKDPSIATASVNDGQIIIKGVKAGTTSISVVDKNKMGGLISVTVK